MNYGICLLSLVPIRNKPQHSSEMVSQLLFGEIVFIEGQHKNWLKIKVVYDNYEGWIDYKQILIITENEFNEIQAKQKGLTTEITDILINETDNIIFPVLLGSSLPGITNNTFYLDKKIYIYTGKYLIKALEPKAENIIRIAIDYLHTPYLWGGRSPFGIDCSGLIQNVFKFFDIKLPRDAYQQAETGNLVPFITEAGTADVAFFEDESGKIVHTGIIISNNRIIHSSGQVRIDNIDDNGIFNLSSKKYTHKLKFIKRFFNNEI